METIVGVELAASGNAGDKISYTRQLADSIVTAGQDGLKIRVTFDDYDTTQGDDCPEDLVVINQSS